MNDGTEVTRPENGKSNVPARVPLATGGRIAAIIPQSIEEVFRLATAVAAAGWAPQSYGNDVNKITIGIMHGMEVGLPPMAGLQGIAVINGRPTLWGDAAIGLVSASGLLEDIEEAIEGTGDTRVARCTVRRKGRPTPIKSTFSVTDAKLAGLASKAGTWQHYPSRMLQMRARGFALRDAFSDVLKGLAIRDREDVIDLTAGADGTYAPRPQRVDFNPDGAGHPDLDAAFRETMREPPITDVSTTPSPPAGAPVQAAESTREGTAAPSDKGSGEVSPSVSSAPSVAVAGAAPASPKATQGEVLRAAAAAQMQLASTTKALRTLWDTDRAIAAYRAAAPDDADALYSDAYDRLKGK